MATIAEMEDALVNADRAGDADAARQLADAIVAARKVQGAQPTAVRAGSVLNDVGRQVGLTARYGLEGLGGTAQILTEPLRFVTDRVTGSTGNTVPLGVLASRAADAVGLPKPQGSTERVVGEATKLMAGTGGMAKAAQSTAKALTPALNELPSVAANVAKSFGDNVLQQTGAAAGAGLAGGASKEAGGSWWQQLLSSVIGGVGGGVGVTVAQRTPELFSGVLNAVKREVGLGLKPADIDVRISTILGRAGVDYSQVPERVRQGLRAELQGALASNKEVSPDAVRRLLDFKTVGATPTRGMVSQDPVQITREMNLAKVAANSADGELSGLPRLQNQNNKTLIDNLNTLGASRGDLHRAGQSTVQGILSRDAAGQRAVSSLYDKARAMPGGEVQLERAPFINGIYNALTKENKLAFLPDDVSSMLDTISRGQVTRNGQTFPVPFDAKALDNLLTTIATAQRGTTDGNVKAALGIVRNAINSTPIQPIKPVMGGNQLVTGSQAATLRAVDDQAPAFMDALNAAREAARQRFAWQESAKPIQAAIDGVEPDKFVQRFVINGSLKDAQAVAKNAPVSEVRDAILAHLKSKALNEASDEVGKFSQSAYNKALNAIGDRKLAVFFSPEEVGQLRAIGRVASYMQTQPVGSAVNNSNSGALLLGRGLDALNSLANKFPLGKVAITEPVQSIGVGIMQNQAQNVRGGLLAPQPSRPWLPAQMIVGPGIAAGGLLAAP